MDNFTNFLELTGKVQRTNGKTGYKQRKFNYIGLNELIKMLTILITFFEIAGFNLIFFQIKEN